MAVGATAPGSSIGDINRSMSQMRAREEAKKKAKEIAAKKINDANTKAMEEARVRAELGEIRTTENSSFASLDSVETFKEPSNFWPLLLCGVAIYFIFIKGKIL